MGSREITCPTCGGTGKKKCQDCDGRGGEEKTYGGETKWYPCTYCSGTGRKTCDDCGGWGKKTVWD